MTERPDRLTWREYAHRTARGYLYVLAPAIAVLFAVQLLLGNETKPQILFIPAAFAWFGWLGTRRFAPKTPAVEPTPASPRLELKAPNPAQGQCPVSGRGRPARRGSRSARAAASRRSTRSLSAAAGPAGRHERPLLN